MYISICDALMNRSIENEHVKYFIIEYNKRNLTQHIKYILKKINTLFFFIFDEKIDNLANNII